MAQVLLFQNVGEEGNKSSVTETPNSRPPFSRIIRDVVSLCKLRRIVVAFLLALFPFPSPAEKDLQFDLGKFFTARNRKKIHPTESRCLTLKFSHKISPVVFTGECIVSKGTKLELVDSVTGCPVRHGPLASAEVEIFLLNGDFGGDGENWTTEELNSHIIQDQRGGKYMLGKNPYLKMQGGVVSVGEIRFKHTPKWMKRMEIRLGARVVYQHEGIKVKEAVTGPFIVKDKRLKSKKRYPPSPTDDVWRLEKIMKNGAFHNRLTENGIRTVEDFLIVLYNSPQKLRRILGNTMPEEYWNTATRHAKTCNLDAGKYGKLVETAVANWENVQKFDSEISINMNHLSSFAKIESLSGCHSGILAMLDERQHSELQNTSTSHLSHRTVENNQWMVSGECSTTSHAMDDQHAESDGMSIATTSPGHPGTGLISSCDNLGYPNQTTSVNLNSESEDIMQFIYSDYIQLDDSSYGEPGMCSVPARV